MKTLLLALAVVSITPSLLNLLPDARGCVGTLLVYAPAHPDNRVLRIQQNDGTDAVDVSEADLAGGRFSRELHLRLGAGEFRTVTAWVIGPKTIRGSAVARVQCLD